MVRKRKTKSVLSDSEEKQLAKKGSKARAEASYGKPDDTDIQNLNILFETYDKVTGGGLKRFINELAVERAFIPNLPPIDSAERFKFSFPADLEGEVRHWWPTLWTDKEHARWFVKHYPRFRSG